MKSIKHNSRKVIFGISASLFLWALEAQAALPPDPNNAALLYYQAFLLRPELDIATAELRDKVLRGAEPDEKIREYLKRCRKTIELAEVAAQIPECNWGIPYSQGFSCNLVQLVQLQHLSFLLDVDARTLAADGDYRAALSRCLTIRRLARHVGDDAVLMYAVSVAVDGRALCCIQHVLGSIPPDANILTWLQGQLAAVRGAPRSPARALKIDFELALQTLRMNAEILENSRQAMLKKEEIKALVKEQFTRNEGTAEEVRSLTNEELIALAGEPYADFLNSALRSMDSEMPYEKKYAEIKRLTEELEKEFGGDPAAKLIMLAHPEKMLTLSIVMACAEQVLKFYNLYVRHTTHLNVLNAAIEIYLAMAKTWQLPKNLPDYLPKDPYSDKDFEYETTEEGFVLRCRVKPIDEREVRQYEFKVQR